jgi:hypothetical protein
MTHDTLRFPYMVWAHTESFVSPYSLAQSGMPSADAALLGPPESVDLAPAGAGALPAVRARLAHLFGVDEARILVTAGASAAMHVVALQYFGYGARVVTELPSYEPFRALPELMGADVRLVERRVEDDFALDTAAVRAALRGGRPGHVFVTSPNNPTGAVLDAAQVVELASSAAEAGGILVSSEVYMEFCQPQERVHAFRLAPNAISIGSLTKAYGLGALRIGWLILGEGLAADLPRLTDMTYLSYVDPPTPSLRAASRALERLEPLLAPLRRMEAVCRPLLVRWLAETDGVTGPPPRFGLAAFPRIDGVEDTRDLARYLAREWGVDVVPGEFFGRSGHLRVGFGVPEETLREGLERLTKGLRAYRARE